MGLGGEFIGLFLLGDLEAAPASALAALLQHLECLEPPLLLGERRALGALAIGQRIDALRLIIDGGIELAHEVLVDANGADFGDLQPGLGGPLAVLEAVAFEHAHGGARTIDIAPGLCRDAGHTIAFLATQFDQQGKR